MAKDKIPQRENDLYPLIRAELDRIGADYYRIENRMASNPGLPDMVWQVGGKTVFVELKWLNFKPTRTGEAADFSHWRLSQRRYTKEALRVGSPETCWMLIGSNRGLFLASCQQLNSVLEYKKLHLPDLDKFSKVGAVDRPGVKQAILEIIENDRNQRNA